MLEAVLKEITTGLMDGGPVKISNFGVFTVRQKAERVGRNPKTGEEVPIKPRRVVAFQPSRNLRVGINHVDDGSGGVVTMV
jgi:integration host factor subunit alpha